VTKPDAHVENVIEVGAPVEVVWEALTTPEGLASFYADRADVTPGEGGSIQIHWEEGSRPAAPIEAWEPNRRLRLTHSSGGRTTIEEWLLESTKGSTVVRLVFEGFGEGTDWDAFYDQFDSTSALLLDLLSHWLTHHRGQPVTVLKARATVALDAADAWKAAFGPSGLAADADPVDLSAGDPVRLAVPGGDPFEATVVSMARGSEALIGIDSLDGARLTVYVRPSTWVGFSLHCYGLSEPELSDLRRRFDLLTSTLEGAHP
jgi:uncharacterized protein YndB with AHSA1/START domain